MLLTAALLIQSVSVPGTQLDVKLTTQVGQPYDARTIEKDVHYLWSLGRFDDVWVEEPEPGTLLFRVKRKQRHVLREVRLEPHSFGLEIKLPPGTPIDRVSAREIARGVEKSLDARVEETLIPRGHSEVDLKLHVIPNKRSREASHDEVQHPSKNVCRTLFVQRRIAQSEGVLDFSVRLDPDGLDIETGRPYRVGRIEFTGNHHFSDSLVRSQLVLAEGALLDDRLLRQSIARINRTGMFDPIDGRHVVIGRDAGTGIADVTLHLTERKRGAWNFAGPWPVEGSVSLRIPKWATYAASVSIFATSNPLLQLPRRFIPIVALQRPFTPGQGWKSGFAVAPQLGWRGFVTGYAATQLQKRLLPRISGERSAEPVLPVEGDTPMACVAKPRWKLVRTAATIAVQALGALPVL
jgi:hypothetical protein